MRIVVLDAETFYDDSFTLSKLTTESYIRDPRFEAHGAAIKWQANIPAKWYDESHLRHILAQEDWSDVLLIAHHMQFDGLILSHHYNVHPKMLGCTLSMARLLIGNHISVSLDSVRKHFGIAPKTTPYHLFKGKHWSEMDAYTRQQLADGCCDEVESIWKIFGMLMQQGFPPEELEVVDTTMKMFCEPVLRADSAMLAAVWEREALAKQQRLEALGLDPSELQSADKFAALLREAGVEPDRKPGKPHADGSEKLIYAFAKTDDFMRDLLEDEDEHLKALAEARLGVKSTALQTRAETLGYMATRGAMCVYLRMYGAHTIRWSGGDGANWQNFKRVDKSKDEPNIRDAILPPDGYFLIRPDLAQIEARLLVFLAGQWDAVEDFRQGRDPYLKLATAAYGFEVTKEMPKERGTGKQLRLSCGYQAGAKTIQNTAKLGIYGPPVYIDLETALRWRDIFREQNPAICAKGGYWSIAGRMISRLAGGDSLQWGPMQIEGGRIILPNGCPLLYDGLEYHKDPETGEANWRYLQRNGWAKLYSGKLVEQTTQALARVIISQAMIRIARTGYRIVNTEHDSLWILIPRDGQQEQHLQYCKDEMKREPAWLPGIPLDCEGTL